jgi:hypothetical protein
MSPRQYLNNRDFRRWGSAYRRSCGRRGAGKELKAPRRGFFTSQTSLPIHRLHRLPSAQSMRDGSETNVIRELTRLIKPRASLLVDLRCWRQPTYLEESPTILEQPDCNSAGAIDNRAPSSANAHRPSQRSRPAQSCWLKAFQKTCQSISAIFISFAH